MAPFFKDSSHANDPDANRPERPPALRAALADLARLTTSRPELAPAGQTLARVLDAMFAAPSIRLVSPTPDDASGAVVASVEGCRSAWQDGRPAIEPFSSKIDFSELAPRVAAICLALGADDPAAAVGLVAVTESPAGPLADWFKLVLENDAERFESFVQDRDSRFDPAQVASVLRLAMLPALADWSLAICSELEPGAWLSGFCPICGSPPALAESRGLDQERRLRCDRCAADWPWRHFQCCYCLTTDHRALRYVFVDGEPDRRRLVLCDHCGGRLKVLSTIGALSAPGLVVAQLDLIDLDLIAEPEPSPPT